MTSAGWLRKAVADYALALGYWLHKGRVQECEICHEPNFCIKRHTGTWTCRRCDLDISRKERAVDD